MPPALAKEKAAKAEQKNSDLSSEQLPERDPPRSAVPLAAPARLQLRSQERRLQENARRTADAGRLASTLTAASASSQPPPVTAADRMAALRRRVGLPDG